MSRRSVLSQLLTYEHCNCNGDLGFPFQLRKETIILSKCNINLSYTLITTEFVNMYVNLEYYIFHKGKIKLESKN